MVDANPIIVIQELDAPVAAVWAAITDPAQMPRWFFSEISEFQPRVGFGTTFSVHAEGEDFVHVWTVTEVVPNSCIAYRWQYAGIEGDSWVRWSLEPTVRGTRLTLRHEGQHSFPQSRSVFTREACEGGWRYFIQERLEAYLSPD